MGAFDRNLAATLYAPRPAPEWIRALRETACAAWGAAPWPTRKTEAWKYTALDALDTTAWLRCAEAGEPGFDAAALVPGLDADRLVFVNGCYRAELSCLGAQPGVRVVNFRAANSGDRATIDGALGQLATGTDNPFVALNGCWLDDGVLLHVGAGVRARRPVHVVHVGAAPDGPSAHAQRLLAVLGRGAELDLVEQFVDLPGAGESLVAGLSELRVGEGARLGHYRLHGEQERAIHIGAVYVELARDARCESLLFALGGALKRIDFRLRHRGQGASCRLDGIYLARHRQHVDLHTTVEHEVAHATTEQVCRGIVDDAARAVFNGRIHIHPQAQKSSAELSNRNLLLSDEAEVDTKPELEIYADDVRCSHGATVSRIDEKSLYYLLTRGIGRREAEVLLGYGFVNELVSRVGDEALAATLREVVRDWLGQPGLPAGGDAA